MNKRLAVVLALWVAAMAAAGPYDYAVSEAVTGLTPRLAEWVRHYGEWPAWVVALCCLPLVRRHRPARATVALALLHPMLVTQSLKVLWGRVRFRDLASAAEYTPFWHPGGAGDSFPSGHVAMSTVLLPLALFAWRRGHRWVLPLAVAYVSVVCWGRVAAGAHYLTDCLFSAGFGLVLAMVLPTGSRPLVPEPDRFSARRPPEPVPSR